MRSSVGQKMQLPGQGCGLVNTVTVVTPESERTGFMRMRASRASSACHSPDSTSLR